MNNKRWGWFWMAVAIAIFIVTLIYTIHVVE